ncbi:hypothetical protein ACX27_14790 [Nostoc piscinale CENA21]|uniref:Uncharacterized protein n=1 Tax=Nostoc piscinale CENA21 TaxID=224013 RepID=A0A0M3V529_9NOSO|nr:hypothetical protein [Nostoc piscinale]ALF52956.1 hypothetical protein ACX27_09000 [Nostoc piscinale CENA21]ALF52977.1 hypothetical protein ACX27_09140 [Nostoc piscinale CENA21]ALF53829.1 hypothetical protein ACX27_14790 [Nostoc piscinale CENA21]
MSEHGGRRTTTWEISSSWKHGKTKTVRIPIALEAQIMDYARRLDAGDSLLHGNSADEREVILSAIARYIGYKNTHYHANQHSKTLDISTRAWDELRRFRGMVAQEPEKLGIKINKTT